MYAELTLSGSYRETGSRINSFVAGARRESFYFEEFYRRCATIRTNRRIRRVLVHVKASFSAAGIAPLEEIRHELQRLAESGKELVFFATEYRDIHLYLASVCARRIIHPLGSVSCVGFARTAVYLKRITERLGIPIEVVRRGRYKSAADPVRIDAMDPAEAEQWRAWLETVTGTVHEAIATGYGVERSALGELLAGRTLDATEACERGWVEDAAPIDEIRERWRAEGGRRARLRVKRHAGTGKRICVLVFEGAIVEGADRNHPLLGQSVGSDSFVRQVDRLSRSRRVKAVVLRVASGGGSAIASEDIRCALTRLAGRKPLVVSMGAIAGSGGYWIAMTGSTVVARATTLTGSIGVITLVAALGEALARHDITHSTIRTHEHADAQRGFRPLTPVEIAELDRQVGSIYERFIELVARTRTMDPDLVRENAEGRVWSGRHACDRGLVDRVGGLADAVEEARQVAGISKARVDFLPGSKRSLIARLLGGASRSTVSPIPPYGVLRAPAATIDDLVNRPLLLCPAGRTGLLDARALDLLDAYLQIE